VGVTHGQSDASVGARRAAEPVPAGAGWQTRRPTRIGGSIVIVGLLITLALAWIARTVNRHNEHRVLVVQTSQAAAVVGSAILGIEAPLSTALHVASATRGDAPQFRMVMSPYVGRGRLFVAAALWKVRNPLVQTVTSTGSPTELNSQSAEAAGLAALAVHSHTFVVKDLRAGREHRVGYAIGDPADPTFVVYAERAIPADRRVPVETGSAFSDLDFATYLGNVASNAALETTDLPPSELPLSGDVARVSIPFGNSTITLLAAPRGQLVGAAGADLPWILLVGGVLLTLAVAVAAEQLIRRRRHAEALATTIGVLYDRLDGLYGEQRTIAATLQRALLPQQLPAISNLSAAARYVSGSDGVDIGGDWYSLDAIDDHRFAFVVGDVSGKGIGAAATMARLRFTIRSYLLEGHPPEVALAMTSRQIDVHTDEHFATVLVGIGDSESGELVVANAGHPDPLLVAGATCEYVGTQRGAALGVGASRYESVTLRLKPGSTLLAFTDGLIERRGEIVDAGLERLLAAATLAEPTLEEWLTRVLSRLATAENNDDIAVLALRWQPAEATARSS
jgi:serine phosphatase RsbU (regulator of sigma subunit)